MSGEIRLFGGVDVAVGGRLVDLGHARQRSVLAVLAVELGRVVTADQLMDRVWGGTPPFSGRETVYGYVSRLRRALAAAPFLQIVSRGGGYVLQADSACVDLHRFRELVERARSAADVEALAWYDEALRLWQGELFGPMESPWLDAVRVAAAAERLSAERDRTDVALRLGHASALVAELTELVAVHPFDERLAGQYMLALYRSGRPADALRHFHVLRARLADELGTDPGEALRNLHLRMLREDVTVPDSGDRPRQLPAPPPLFVGRLEEMARLTKIRDLPGTRICVIGGVGGIGKTWLAVQWAHQNLDQFPDGQLYTNLHGFAPATEPVSPAQALRGFLVALGADIAALPADAEGCAVMFRSRIAGRRMLLVLDNARDSRHVELLLPGTPECMVIVTSRSQLAGLRVAGAQAVEVPTLAEQDSRRVLAQHLGAERVAAEPTAVAELVDRCAGLPLALGIVAARSDLPLAALLHELRNTSAPLSAWDAGEMSANLAEVFSWSYDAVSETARSAFRLLGLAPGPDIELRAAAALAGLPVESMRITLRALENARLVEQHQPSRYRMHDLLRLFAMDRAGRELSDVERTEALGGLVAWLTRAAHAAMDVADPHRRRIELTVADVTVPAFGTADDGFAWLDQEHQVLVDAVSAACGAGLVSAAAELAQALGRFFLLRNHHQDWLRTHRLVLEGLGENGDPGALAEIHQDLSIACVLTGDYDAATVHAEQALTLRARLGDQRGEASILGNLGLLCVLRGRYPEAVRHSELAAARYAGIGDKRGEANAYNALGLVRFRLGLPAEADARTALGLHREIGDQVGIANSLSTLASICRHAGRAEEAIELFGQAVEVSRGIGYRSLEADCLAELALVCAVAGDSARARAHAADASALIAELGAPAADSGAYNDLARPSTLWVMWSRRPPVSSVRSKQPPIRTSAPAHIADSA